MCVLNKFQIITLKTCQLFAQVFWLDIYNLQKYRKIPSSIPTSLIIISHRRFSYNIMLIFVRFTTFLSHECYQIYQHQTNKYYFHTMLGSFFKFQLKDDIPIIYLNQVILTSNHV